MEIWDRLLCQFDLEFGKETVDRWLRSLCLVRFDAANIYFETKDSFQIAWFEEHIRPLVKHLVSASGRPIRIHLSSLVPKKIKNQGSDSSFPIAPDSLDPEMTLEHLILQKAPNAIAFHLVSEAEKCLFNPVLLYGPPSSGKTHFLMAAATLLKKKGLKAFYIRAETFTEHVVQAIRKGTMQAVRAAYRSADALLVDDIHVFSRKTATQEEFFHTFNELHTRGCPILLSSQFPPPQLQEIEPRLVSRFEWGVSVGLEKEDWALILAKKAALWKLSIDPELPLFLIQKFPSSPLQALQALALRAKDAPKLTSALGSLLLKDLLEKEVGDLWTPEKIFRSVAAHYDIRPTDILGKSQSRETALPRQIAMYICREKLKLPFQKIGKLFGRDHSTVMASVKQVQEAVANQKSEVCEAIAKLFLTGALKR